MDGKECITWLEEKYGNLERVINYGDIVKKHDLTIVFDHLGEWKIYDNYLEEFTLTEEVLNIALDYYENSLKNY